MSMTMMMSLQDIQTAVLSRLAPSDGGNENENEKEVDSRVIGREMEQEHQSVVGAMNSLAAREMITLTLLETQQWHLSPEGDDLLQHGSHEAKTFHSVPSSTGGIKQQELLASIPSASIGLGKALKAGWLALEGGVVTRKVAEIRDVTQEQLLMIKSSPADPHLDESILKELKKRKLAAIV
jgi:phenylalanyl-tRNA synthetase alpha chain